MTPWTHPPPPRLPSRDTPSDFGEALKVWFKIGCLSFGGPAGQIALMHRVVVDEKKWIDESRFLHALNYCMLLPGPEANSSPPIPAGCCMACAAGLPPASCSSARRAVMLALSLLYAYGRGVPRSTARCSASRPRCW